MGDLLLNITTGDAQPSPSTFLPKNNKRKLEVIPKNTQPQKKQKLDTNTSKAITNAKNKKENEEAPEKVKKRKPLLYVSNKSELAEKKKQKQIIAKALQEEIQTKEKMKEKQAEMFEDDLGTGGFELINEKMRENLEKHLSITRATKIQMKAFPAVLSKRDMFF